MREIKFRGKRVDNGEWVYGSYHKHISRQMCPIGDELKESDIKHLIIQSGFADWNMPKPLQAIEVIPETVGQDTGLEDKNGTEIYEGDIVKIYDFDYDETTIGKVQFNGYGNYPAFHIPEFDSEINSFSEIFDGGSCEIEVIGNIHDNPELLEVE